MKTLNCMLLAGPPSLYYYWTVLLHSCIVLPPVVHPSNHDYHCCQLTDDLAVFRILCLTVKVFIWLSLVILRHTFTHMFVIMRMWHILCVIYSVIYRPIHNLSSHKIQRNCSHFLWTRYQYTEKCTFHDKLQKFYRSVGIWIKITSRNILLIPVLGRSLGNTVDVSITWIPNSEIARI